MTLRLKTAFGTEEDATPTRIAEALRSVDRADDPEHFVVVERDDGVFVQLKPEGPLEVGGLADAPHRLDHAELARRMIERLGRRQDPWGDLPHWDLSPRMNRQARVARRSRITVYALLLAVAAAAAVGWYLRRG
jgi:hypothetical protein